MLTLGIETSCDETAVALYDTTTGLLSHDIYSQIALHNDYGGVVPELASRDHIKKLLPMIESVLNKAHLHLENIDGIAYTRGPGLIGALMVGAAVAQGLALSLNCPIIGVHHMEGHLLAPLLEENKPEFPFVALLVSGGHTMLVKVEAIGRYELLGESIDDAAGEAFDKTAKILGLPYPGGAHLAKLAESGDPKRFKLPRPMLKENNLNFSFSGLKTAALQTFKTMGALSEADTLQYKKDLAASFQAAVVDTLIYKCHAALQQTRLNTLVIAGGVSANLQLREQLKQLGSKEHFQVFYPRLEFCTDNAAMIALTGALRLTRGEQSQAVLDVRARWPLAELNIN